MEDSTVLYLFCFVGGIFVGIGLFAIWAYNAMKGDE